MVAALLREARPLAVDGVLLGAVEAAVAAGQAWGGSVEAVLRGGVGDKTRLADLEALEAAGRSLPVLLPALYRQLEHLLAHHRSARGPQTQQPAGRKDRPHPTCAHACSGRARIRSLSCLCSHAFSSPELQPKPGWAGFCRQWAAAVQRAVGPARQGAVARQDLERLLVSPCPGLRAPSLVASLLNSGDRHVSCCRPAWYERLSDYA